MSENGKRRGPVLIEMADPEASPRRGSRPVLDAPPLDAPVMPETPPRPEDATAAPRADDRARRAPRDAGGDAPSPADAPMIDDGLKSVLPEPRTMQLVARLVGKGPSPLTRFFSLTSVWMDSREMEVLRGDYHKHVYGEINCIVPYQEGAQMKGMQGWMGKGWTSPGAGTHHYPQVRRSDTRDWLVSSVRL